MGAGRKLRTLRREERWADKEYCRSNLGSEWKKPFAGTSHSKGIVLEKMCVHLWLCRPSAVCVCVWREGRWPRERDNNPRASGQLADCRPPPQTGSPRETQATVPLHAC